MLILLVRGRCEYLLFDVNFLRAERDMACLSQPFCFLRVVGFPLIPLALAHIYIAHHLFASFYDVTTCSAFLAIYLDRFGTGAWGFAVSFFLQSACISVWEADVSARAIRN